MDTRVFAALLLTCPEYQTSLKQRLIDGDVPEEIETMLWRLACAPPDGKRQVFVSANRRFAGTAQVVGLVPRPGPEEPVKEAL